LTLGGIAFGAYHHKLARDAFPKETFSDKVRAFSPAESWDLWTQYLRHGIGWQPQTGPQREAAVRRSEELWRWALLGYGLGGAGVLVALVGLMLMRGGPVSKPRPAPKRRQPASQGN
jgi:hypothetical protein